MVEISGFEQYQFVIGCQYDRTFGFDNTFGIITDYVLGEAGADGSPVPSGFYKKVAKGTDFLEITGDNDKRKFFVSRDQLILTECSAMPGKPFSDIQANAVARAKHLFFGTLAFLNKPNIRLLGFVFDFARKNTKDQERFCHPAAESLVKKTLALELEPKEHPSEFDLQLTIRKQMNEAFLLKDINDYANIRLCIKDKLLSQVWGIEEKTEEENTLIEAPRTTVLSVDIQKKFDPRRELTVKMFEEHWLYSERYVTGRFKTLVEGMGLGK